MNLCIKSKSAFVNFFVINIKCGPGQYSQYRDFLLAGLSGNRILMGTRLSSPVQRGVGPTQTHITWVRSFLPGVQRPEREVNLLLPSSAKLKGRVELYFYFPFGPSWPVLGRTLLLLLLYSINAGIMGNTVFPVCKVSM